MKVKKGDEIKMVESERGERNYGTIRQKSVNEKVKVSL